jgi:hypothetical protein
MRVKMDRKFIAVTGVLILAGVALAFAFVFIVSGENGRAEDIWLVPNSPVSETSDLSSGTGSQPLQPVVKNDTTPLPVVATNWSNVSVRTLKILAYNQSAMLLSPSSPGGKPGMMYIDRNNSETKTGALTTEQRNLAEKIALADARVRDIIGAGMYTEDIQPLDTIRVKDSEDVSANGTYASIAFTLVNTTTAKNETAFFVHVDLDNNKVVRVSPTFPQERVTTDT